MKYRFFAALAALLFAFPVAVDAAPLMPGEPAAAPKVSPVPRLRLERGETASRARLAPVSPEELAAVRDRNASRTALENRQQRLTVGLARPASAEALAAAAFDWKPVPGGSAARVALTSPEAGSVRLAIDLAGVPRDVEMVFFGSHDPSRLEGPIKVGDIADRTVPWWSPLTEGDTQTVEIFVPSKHSAADLPLVVVGASHLFTTPSSRFAKRVQDIGDAGACNVDLACSPLASDAAFRNAANSVAQMVFNDAGFTVLCTGTLLADGDAATQAPWLYGANHCFENEDAPYKTAAQMQAVANTLNTLWGFEAGACNSQSARSGWTQLAGGATFVHNDVASDVLFLRLNSAPPAGAFYSGWDANPLSAGNGVVSAHHPLGDLKKVTQGSVVRFSSPGVANANASYVETRWSSGTTESGSSGAGIWTSAGGQYYFRGGLWGGAASCGNLSGADYFSRFDQAYPALARYLGSGAAPAADYTDLWWNPGESGWGLNLVQHPSRVIFGVWFTYEADGTRTWYVMPSGSWTSSNTYAGPLYATLGPPFTSQFDPKSVEVRQVGNATLTFSGADNGTFAYTVDGVSGTKSITRQPF
jgi:hypothetical protein